METLQKESIIYSDALKANLEETFHKGELDEALKPLLDIVRSYKGLYSQLDNLLLEIGHPYRNWQLIIPELRAFVLKNFNIYYQHKNGPYAFALFTRIYFMALNDAKKNGKLITKIMEAMLAYADKFINSVDQEGLSSYQDRLNSFFRELLDIDKIEKRLTMYMVQGHHPIKKMVMKLVMFSDNWKDVDFDYRPAALLMKKILSLNYSYWLNEDDPYPWLMEHCGEYCRDWQAGVLFSAISHEKIQSHLESLNAIVIEEDPLESLKKLLQLPNHMDIVRLYRDIPARLSIDGDNSGQQSRFVENRKLLFLFRIMDTEGLYLIHEETLREINRSLVQLIRKQSFEDIEHFFGTTFQLLKANVRKYPRTSLQCIKVIGGEVFKRGNSRLVEAFLWETVRFGFQHANVVGVDEDWQPITNPAHLANIRVWLNLIMQEPKWCSTLFSAMIINLKLTGTCVKDTDLFQRDITDLLNHPISPIYNLTKQFTKLMPVFFNEIGAEGELRDVSTEIDELHNRRDILIHFLRKQSHVESSNLIVGFIGAIFGFWLERDKERLRPYLPSEIFAQVKTKGSFIDEQYKLSNRIKDKFNFANEKDILYWDDLECQTFIDNQDDISLIERKRYHLLVKMFKLLHHKYNFGMQELRNQLQIAVKEGFTEVEGLIKDLEEVDTFKCLNSLLKHLERLKRIILSEEKFVPKEEIYYKRHIAVDIPSVYGRYSEKKFDALGLTFRLENFANIFLERLGQTVNLSFITQATIIRINKCLRLYLRALQVDGITSRRLDTYTSLLASSTRIKRFSYTQFLDIFRGLSEGVKDVIYAYYTNVHHNNLSIIIPQISQENLLTKYRPLWDENDSTSSVHRLSESFFRDLIASTFGLQHLDNFISKIITTLEAQKDILDQKTLDLLMTYSPDKTISSFSHENIRTHNLIHLGNKGFNLMALAKDGKPVPPAFVITTEIFRCWPAVKSFDTAREEFMHRVRKSINDLEEQTGLVYGSPEKPLLLSIRSGSAISMPGMMTTIHNAGLNEELIEEYVKDHNRVYFAWDNYRRFLQSWAMAMGMVREDFQKLMNEHKALYQVRFKKEFSPDQMRELALKYRDKVRSKGFEPPDDPWLQLISAVEMVLDSWNTNKAKEYRRLMDVSDSWGTAVIVQAMVYGNLKADSGSGVLFTAHPYRKVRRVALWGDYAPGDQGEDIVSGLVSSYPISVEQAELDGRSVENSLEVRFPEIYKQLLCISRDLVYTRGWNPQEIEFTFEGPAKENLYILQTRDMITIKKKERFNVFIETDILRKSVLGKGIGVSGSAISGRAVFNEDDIHRLRREDPKSHIILIRQDTVPEDIREIFLADGLLTSRGGQTSHASIVATRLGKTCVVGCRDLQVYETEGFCEINNTRICFGDPVSIDGRNGMLLKGLHEVREEIHILPL